jgi:hypothetical protein
VATERQIAANRRNARKSTGPRSRGGRTRTRRNAYRHGLTLGLKSSAIENWLQKFARKIAADSNNEILLDYARAAAQAELDLARVRLAKTATIQRVSALGTPYAFDHFEAFTKRSKELRRLARDLLSYLKGRGPEPIFPEPIDPTTTMPTQEPERTAEAVRRALPELLKLHRYEARAVSRRDRAIRQIVKIRSNSEL